MKSLGDDTHNSNVPTRANYMSVSNSWEEEDHMLTTTDVSLELVLRYGIRASRDRIARLADLLLPRTTTGKHRRFTPDQLDILAVGIELLDSGMTRREVAEALQDPKAAAELLREQAAQAHRRKDAAADRLEQLAQTA